MLKFMNIYDLCQSTQKGRLVLAISLQFQKFGSVSYLEAKTSICTWMFVRTTNDKLLPFRVNQQNIGSN